MMSDPRAAWPDQVSDMLMDLAKRCTDMDSHRRPFIVEVLQELRGIAQMERYSNRKVCETKTVTADTTDRESSSAFCGQSRDHQKGSEYLMLGQLKKKTRENLDHDQERKPDKDESESHSLLQTSLEKAAAKKLYAHRWINPSLRSRHSSSGVSSIQLKDYQGSGNDFNDVASSQERRDSFLESSPTTVDTRCYRHMPLEASLFSTQTDVYSFGRVLFEMVTGLPPHSSNKKLDLATFFRQMEAVSTEVVAMFYPQARLSRLVYCKEALMLIGMEALMNEIVYKVKCLVKEPKQWQQESFIDPNIPIEKYRKIFEKRNLSGYFTNKNLDDFKFVSSAFFVKPGSNDLMTDQSNKNARDPPYKSRSLTACHASNASVAQQLQADNKERKTDEYESEGHIPLQTTLETVAAENLFADQWTKSSAPSRHSSSGGSNRRWRKDYKGSDSNADNVSSCRVSKL
ncbi:uncharacterized protein LOC134188046 isoform X2 [Corticium candelabrum]|uniref:uncharacterized protein LOC134188046 isoform X2 n=1 Tax=Corticium candelabrum TaxID=121492 RepID=UPI002E257281|nr:uncharacterized protein LOC134188046 isoform X2 [Corticium candelabrum]